jgi:hypothetical protein
LPAYPPRYQRSSVPRFRQSTTGPVLNRSRTARSRQGSGCTNLCKNPARTARRINSPAAGKFPWPPDAIAPDFFRPGPVRVWIIRPQQKNFPGSTPSKQQLSRPDSAGKTAGNAANRHGQKIHPLRFSLSPRRYLPSLIHGRDGGVSPL